ncbi:MAG: hypothetical protein QM813_12450 [Verrucomicrobiota bacterium]
MLAVEFARVLERFNFKSLTWLALLGLLLMIPREINGFSQIQERVQLMGKIATLITLVATVTCSYAVGLVNFANSPFTLISVGGQVMPLRSVQQYNFAVFLAPSTTVATTGITPSYFDPAFQLAAGYTTNHYLAPAAGRVVPVTGLDVGSVAGFAGTTPVDFVVRGWSINLGATWAEALVNWNHGAPLIPDAVMGSSTIGNDLYLGDGGIFPNSTLFGVGQNQVQGFNLVPEPTCAVLGGLGALAMVMMRRRK